MQDLVKLFHISIRNTFIERKARFANSVYAIMLSPERSPRYHWEQNCQNPSHPYDVVEFPSGSLDKLMLPSRMPFHPIVDREFAGAKDQKYDQQDQDDH